MPSRRVLRRNPELRPSPYGKDLLGMDLKGQDLSYMDLSGADLTVADLTAANLTGANLEGADLRGAKLISADLIGASLRGANLSGAKLITANLSGADLGDANFTGANFIGADLSSAKLAGADLTRANLPSATLTGANLINANLTGAILIGTNFSDANLSGANLKNAYLAKTDFTGVDLTQALNVPRFGPLREHYEIKTPTSPAFNKWFGDSVVVGDDKKPVVVYHGTARGGFTVFDPAKRDPHHNAFYFTDSMDVSETYVGGHAPETQPDPAVAPGEDAGIYRLYIKLVNPMIVEGQGREWNDLSDPRAPGLKKTFELTKWAQAHGHDGVIFKDIRDNGGRGAKPAPPATVYAVFDPKAIKSATANNGNYDPNDADIRHNPRRLPRAPRQR